MIKNQISSWVILLITLLLTLPLSSCMHNSEKSALPEIRIIENSQTRILDTSTWNRKDKPLALNQIAEYKDRVCVIGYAGEFCYATSGSFALKAKSVACLAENGQEIISSVAGVMTDPPSKSVTDIKPEVIDLISQGQRVLVVLLDGFGYEMYKKSSFKNTVETRGDFKVEPALTSYRPVSNAALAAMLTGLSPVENQVIDRNSRVFKGEDLFAALNTQGKKCIYLEGDVKMLATSLEPLLNPDLNGDGSTDQEVFDSALAAMASAPDLLFIHFHGIDDAAHQFGPYAPATQQRIDQITAMTMNLSEKWPGTTIIIADHGLHPAENGGDHGEICLEDMIVPYIISSGGGNYE